MISKANVPPGRTIPLRRASFDAISRSGREVFEGFGGLDAAGSTGAESFLGLSCNSGLAHGVQRLSEYRRMACCAAPNEGRESVRAHADGLVRLGWLSAT